MVARDFCLLLPIGEGSKKQRTFKDDGKSLRTIFMEELHSFHP